MGIKNKKMSEGRKTQIVLLDERRLEILIQPKLLAVELLDMVASHFSLKEKEYFGLCFKDETNPKQSKDRKSSFPSSEPIDSGHYHWLQLDRKVLEHDFPKKTGPLVLFFSVRFFIESITYLRDNATIELFYLQAKHSIFKDQLECDCDTVFELAAHALQATYGDYTNDETAKEHLKKLPLLPTSALKEHLSISYCEDEVTNIYKKLSGQSRGSAIVNYMTIVEALPTYGIHYYEVKDKAGIPWWLGLSYKGIAQYDYNDRKVPRKVFAWKQLENLYFRDKKFSIEVHDPKRIVHTLSSFNLYEDAIQEPIEEFDDLSDAISDPTTQVSVSRRTFGPGNVNVHAWFASTPALTKCIWSMAVSQHQFYLDRKQSKSHLPSVRSMSEIAADLCQSTSSLPSSASGSISRSNSAHSLTMSMSTNNTKLEYTTEEIDPNQAAAEKEMFAALKVKKEALEDALRKKTEELKALCLKESELTGELPPEFPLIAGELVPQVRRRVGTAFTLSPKIINRDKASQEEEMMGKLELDYETQDKITKAARRLAEDVNAAKSVRKQRRQTYHKAHQKLKELERRVNEARRTCGKLPVKAQSVEEAEITSPLNSPAIPHRNSHIRDQQPQIQQVIPSPRVEVVEFDPQASPSMGRPLTPSSSQGSCIQRSGSPVSPSHQGAPGYSRGSTPSPNPQRPLTGGYTPNALYQTRTQYRMQNYPTFTTRSHSSSSTQSEYDNVNGSNRSQPPPQQHQQQHQHPASSSPHLPSSHLHYNNNPNEAIHNFYNVSTNQMTHYNSADELGKSSSSDDLLNEMREQEHLQQNQVWLPSKHGSLEGAYRKRNQSGDGHVQRYMNAQMHGGQYAPQYNEQGFIIPHLTPSRFGSKRESTADYRDSMYPSEEYTLYNMDDRSQSGSSNRDDYDFPPPPPPHELNHWSEDGPHHPHHPSGGYYLGHGGQGGYHTLASVRDQSVLESDNGVPYMDSPRSGSQQYANDSSASGIRQQPPPHTPKTEVPPQPFAVQDSPYDSSSALSPSMDSPQQVMTVTKYQSYVEVSKPFEMSDFYKYSEKLRKQRTINNRQQKLEAVLSGQPLPKSAEGPPPVPVRYNSYISSATTPGGSSPGPLSPVSSAYGSPARPSSPFNNSSQGSQRSSRPSSPYTGGHIQSPPSPGTFQNVQSVRTRGPYAVQSNLVQTQYHAQSMAYQQANSPQTPSPAPQHMPYQAPKAMTCEPLRSAKPPPSSQYNRYMNDSMNYYDEPLLSSPAGNYMGDSSHNNSSFYSNHSTPHNSYYDDHAAMATSINNNNLSSFDMGDVAHAFSEEMLAWYDDQDQHKPSTLV